MRNHDTPSEQLLSELEALRAEVAELRSAHLKNRLLIKSLESRLSQPEAEPIVGANKTDRQQTPAQLQLLQFSLDHGGDPTFFIAPDARFTYVNQAACT